MSSSRPRRPSRAVVRRRTVLVAVISALAVVLYLTVDSSPRRHHLAATPTPRQVATQAASPSSAAPTQIPSAATSAVGHLAAGSDPSVLPGPLLIADKNNNRLLIVDPQGRLLWQFPRPGDLAPGQQFLIPDDAFFSADGRYIVATEEDDFVISVIDVATHRIVWRYGTPGVAGSGFNHLDNPDDAMLLPGGDVIAADIKNCRLVVISPGGRQLLHTFGTTGACAHNPPQTFGSPNGMFPLRDGNFLITEINGSWVDEMTPSGQIAWSAHPPGINYPSDSNQYAPDTYLTADYSSPGQIILFNRAGQLIYQYAPSGAGQLDHPSLALPLPNGDIVLNDDFNHRVIVIDPRTSRVVWQYGVTHVAGTSPGFLNNPDGVDLAPPHSFLVASGSSLTPPT